MKNMHLNFFNQLSYTPYKWRGISNQKAFEKLITSALSFFFIIVVYEKKTFKNGKVQSSVNIFYHLFLISSMKT